MELNKARDLLQRYRNGNCSPEEIQLIEQWFDQLSETGEAQFSEQEIDDLQQSMESRLLQQIGPAEPETRSRSLYRSLRWVAAAAIILGLGISSWFLLNKNQVPAPQAPAIVGQDIEAPASNRARITLANGQQVYLDETANGQLAMQGNVKIVKSANGEITYQSTDGILTDAPVNTLSNPRGSKVASITLSDGSRVWLNAGSSLTYPVAFTGKERQVSITGEAYFEVAQNKQLPFIVKKDALTIRVLGTHFNVNAYDEETSGKVTLLEGVVNVSGTAGNVLLKPGQQAMMSEGNSKVLNDVDIDEVMAWKNGLFIFKGENIRTIMHQLERWYDVDVQFEKNVTEKFYVKMDRNTQVSNVFKILEATGGVHFEIKGKKIIVKP